MKPLKKRLSIHDFLRFVNFDTHVVISDFLDESTIRFEGSVRSFFDHHDQNTPWDITNAELKNNQLHIQVL